MHIAEEVEIMAPPESVWRVASDLTHFPKLLRDATTVEADPPGPASVGQRYKLMGKVGAMKVSSTFEFTRVEKGRLLESRGLAGGVFTTFHQLVTLTQKGWDTMVSVSIDYAVLPEMAGMPGSPTPLESAIEGSFRSYAHNLKELSELLPLPE